MGISNYLAIKKQWLSGQAKGNYLVCGMESFFIDQLADLAASKIIDEGSQGFNQIVVFGKDVDFHSLYHNLTRYPMMSDKQLVIIKEAQEFKHEADLIKYLERSVETTILVMLYREKSLAKTTNLYTAFSKYGTVVPCDPLKEQDLIPWLKSLCQELGVAIDEKAIHLLVELAGNQLHTLHDNIVRLKGTTSSGEPITFQMVKEHVKSTRSFATFALQDALAKGDPKYLLKLAHHYAENEKDFPMPVISGMLTSFLAKCAGVVYNGSDAETLRKLGINEYTKHNIIRYAGRMGRRIAPAIALVNEYDLKFKGVNHSGSDREMLVKELILKLTALG